MILFSLVLILVRTSAATGGLSSLGSIDTASLSELSRLQLDTKDLGLDARCKAFETKLREFAQDKTSDRSQLFSDAVALLSARRRMFDNQSPALMVLQECQRAALLHTAHEEQPEPEPEPRKSTDSKGLEMRLLELEAQNAKLTEANQRLQQIAERAQDTSGCCEALQGLEQKHAELNRRLELERGERRAEELKARYELRNLDVRLRLAEEKSDQEQYEKHELQLALNQAGRELDQLKQRLHLKSEEDLLWLEKHLHKKLEKERRKDQKRWEKSMQNDYVVAWSSPIQSCSCAECCKWC